MHFEQGNINRYQEMIASLKKRFDDAQEKVKEVEIVLETKNTEINNADLKVSDAQLKLTEIEDKLSKKNNEYLSIISEITNKKKDIKTLSEICQDSLQNNKNVIQLVSKNRAELLEYEKENESVKKDIVSHKTELDNLVGNINEEKEKLSSVKKEISKIEKQKEEFVNKKKELDQEYNDYKEKVEKLTDYERLLTRAANEINSVYKELNIDKNINIWQEQQ